MINRWTILNLRTRPERRLLAVCSAWRQNVPLRKMHIWHGDLFETPEELRENAILQGFRNFDTFDLSTKDVRGSYIPEGTSHGCDENTKGWFNTATHCYNVLMYLKDRITRPGFEAFVHDDVYLETDFKYLEKLCADYQNMSICFLNRSYTYHFPIATHFRNDIKTPRLIKGLHSDCDFAWVLSQKGAEDIYERFLADKYVLPIECIRDPRGKEKGVWRPKGSYTVMSDIAQRYSTEIVGSDTYSHHIKGIYQQANIKNT